MLCKMKQPSQGFELWSPSPFSTTKTNTPQSPVCVYVMVEFKHRYVCYYISAYLWVCVFMPSHAHSNVCGYVQTCASACVCVRERERERG